MSKLGGKVPELDSTFSAALFAFLGVALAKIIDVYVQNRKVKSEDRAVNFGELRAEVAEVKAQMNLIRIESSEWQRKFYELSVEYGKLAVKFENLTSDHEELKNFLKYHEELRKFLKEKTISIPGVFDHVEIPVK